jgi:hypothetical protein
MATTRDANSGAGGATRRRRLTLDLDPKLHLRIKVAAAHAGLSMREYLEQMLDDSVPALPRNMRGTGSGPALDILERLARTRKALSGGRLVPDSTEIVRQMREEQALLDDPL